MGRITGYFLFKGLFGGLAVVGFILLLLVGILESGAGSKETTALTSMEALGRENYINSAELDLNYMNKKRKVPNGPDPIHNRRAGNSGRPPGQS